MYLGVGICSVASACTLQRALQRALHREPLPATSVHGPRQVVPASWPQTNVTCRYLQPCCAFGSSIAQTSCLCPEVCCSRSCDSIAAPTLTYCRFGGGMPGMFGGMQQQQQQQQQQSPGQGSPAQGLSLPVSAPCVLSVFVSLLLFLLLPVPLSLLLSWYCCPYSSCPQVALSPGHQGPRPNN